MTIAPPSWRQLRWMLSGSLLLCAMFWLWLTVSQHESTLAIRPVGQGIAMPDGFSVWHHLDANGIRFKSITPQKDGLLIKFDSNAQAPLQKKCWAASCRTGILLLWWMRKTRPPFGYPACATRRIGLGDTPKIPNLFVRFGALLLSRL